MQGLNILITGSAQRIGQAIATDLNRSGCNLALHYNRSKKAVNKLLQLLPHQDARAIALQADLSHHDQAANLLDRAEEKLQAPIDCIINNASIFEDDSSADFSMEALDKHLAIHLHAPAIIAQSLIKKKRQKDQLIINMIDQRVKALNPRFFTYTLSKSALWTMTQTLAQSAAPSIRVNAIGPGPTLKNSRQSDADFAKQSDNLLLKKPVPLDDFAQTITYFWNAKSITGQIIMLDCGQHLAWETPDIANITE